VTSVIEHRPAEAPSLRTIVCGVDFSALAGAALDLAVSIAREHGAAVHAVHADESAIAPLADVGLAPGGDEGLREALREQLASDLARLGDRGVKLVPRVEAGPAAEVLRVAAVSLGADLVVVGTHGRTALSHALLGSVAERVVQISPTSVLTVPRRGTTRWPFRTVVCATDFSEGAQAALRASLSLARGARNLHVVHVLEAASFLGQFDGEAADALVSDLRSALDEEVERHAPPAQRIMKHVRGGIVYDQILDEAERADADLVVLGATGHSGVERALLGSTTARVVRGSRIPVLVVRSGR
jgi:nucleotide-binding universal stress UspA family protein